MTRTPRRLALVLVLGSALHLMTGCGESPARDPIKPPPPAAFLPEQFPDIPLPPNSYMLSPDADQLAISLAGGSVRRFDVQLERRPTVSPQSAKVLLAFVKRDLEEREWHLVSSDDTSQHWHKGNEDLLVETGRMDSRTTIRYRLRPAPLPAP